MMRVTAGEHVHDRKPLLELVNGITKSDSMTTTGKLFANDGAYMKVMRFLDIYPQTLDSSMHKSKKEY